MPTFSFEVFLNFPKFLSGSRSATRELQKQLYADVLQNSCSSKFSNIHSKAQLLEPHINKA